MPSPIERKRSAPHRLVTIVFSHYNEKARWALDYCGIEYEEQRLMPVFSQLGVMLATRGRGGRADRVSTRFSTPVLIASDGTRLCDSTEIARWASSQVKRGGADPLFPNDEVVDLVEHYGRKYGAHTRLAAYWHVLRNESALSKMADANVGRAQALAFRAIAPLGSVLIRNALGVTKDGYERSLARIREEIEQAGRRLERTKYLAGDTFTAADLTFAALSAPILLVTREEGYGATFPSLDDLPDDTRALVAEMRATRAGAFALGLFRKYRGASVTSASHTAAVTS